MFRRFLYFSLCILFVQLAWGDPLITEFMASNQNSIEDDDGSRSDWIEIHNPDATPVNLENWSLTDNAGQLRKWVFPAVTLPAGAYMIVYASDKNRRAPGLPLHTSFALSAGGEYLALVKPDGVTKASEFAPEFPQQFADVSYGVANAVSEQTVLELGSPVRVKVPTNGADGTNWRNRIFDDSSWTSGTQAVGYFNYNGTSSIDLSSRVNLHIAAQMGGQQTTAYLRLPFTISDPGAVVSMTLRMNYDDGFAAFVNGGFVAISTESAPPLESLAFNSGATTQIPVSEDEGGYKEFDGSSQVGQLVAGTNILAIHGLNAGTTSSDFFIEAQLIVRTAAGGGGEIGYFSVATPGAANGGPDTLQLPQTVAFSRQSGTFTAGFSLVLSGAPSGKQIRYVLADPTGSPNAAVPEPTMDSPLYTGPIAVSSSKVIRAAVFDPVNGQRGMVRSAQYLQLETAGGGNNTSGFTSQLPIVVIDNHGGGEFFPGQPYRNAFLHVFEPAAGTASLNSTSALFSRIGQRVRGSSSAHFPKRALAMKTWNENNENLKREILGLAEDASWVWYNPWKYDDVFIHNAFLFQLSREMGQWASRTQPVEMFMNVNGGKLDYSDYWGVLVLTEKIESGSERLDIAEIGPGDTTGDALTGGYILKYDRADEDETSWYSPLADNDPSSSNDEARLVLVEPEQEDETSEQVAYIQDYIADFEAALVADRNSNWATRNYLKYIDLPSWIDVHMLNAFAINPDSFRLSSYFHKDRNGKLKAGPIWDFDRGFDADKDNNETPYTPREWNGTHFDMGWWKQVWRDPEWIQAWVDRWWELRQPGWPMSDESLDANVSGWGNMIGNVAGARDAAKWPDNVPETGSYLNEVAAFRTWLISSNPANLGRTHWIDAQVPGPPTASLASGIVSAGTTVSLSGSDNIRYRTNGSDPRPLGGATAGGVSYSGPITINQTSILKARRYRSGNYEPFPHGLTTKWSAPLLRVYLVNETFATSGDLIVSEIGYDPDPATPEEREVVLEAAAGEFEFIELRNMGSQTVNTFEMKMVQGNPGREILLDPLSVEPGETALVVKNRAAFLARHGSGLASRIVGEWREGSLSNDGETIEFLARGGSPLASVDYPAIASQGQSLNRVDSTWKTDVPSPGSNGPTYQQWKDFHFKNGGVVSADDADGDLDASINTDEYARGSDPTVAENPAAFQPVLTVEGEDAVFTFKTPVDRPSAAYQAQWASVIGTWNALTSTPVSSALGVETREATQPIAADSAPRFFRVKTTVTP